jgi:hypothetical protein
MWQKKRSVVTLGPRSYEIMNSLTSFIGKGTTKSSS